MLTIEFYLPQFPTNLSNEKYACVKTGRNKGNSGGVMAHINCAGEIFLSGYSHY